MQPLHINIEQDTLNNPYYRMVIHTTPHSQVALMNIPPGADVERETHNGDQFTRIESGNGIIELNKVPHILQDGVSVSIPAGTEHYILNTGNAPLKLYTIYSPPQDSPTRIEGWDEINKKPVILRD